MEEQISFKDYSVFIPLLGFNENMKILTTLVTSVQCGSFTPHFFTLISHK